MKINKIVSQNRRDFIAIYECEHCGNEFRGSGYDDSFFHAQVIPKMECKGCGKVSSSDYQPLATKYSEHQIV